MKKVFSSNSKVLNNCTYLYFPFAFVWFSKKLLSDLVMHRLFSDQIYFLLFLQIKYMKFIIKLLLHTKHLMVCGYNCFIGERKYRSKLKKKDN